MLRTYYSTSFFSIIPSYASLHYGKSPFLSSFLQKSQKRLAFYPVLVYYNIRAQEQHVPHGPLAQLAEHLTLNQGVQGSIP